MTSPLRRWVKNASWPLVLLGGGAAVGYVGGGAVGPLLAHLAPEDPSPAALFGLLASLPMLAWMAILVHEAGHVLGGVASGLEFRFLAAGPLWLERREGQLGLRLNRLPSAWGGLALCTPRGPEADLERFARYFLGGPAASLLLTLIGLGAAALCFALLGPSWLAVGAVALSGVSLAIFAATALLPSASTDGARYRALRRKDQAARAEAAMLVVTGLVCAGVRPREWPASTVAAIDGLERPEARAAGGLFAAQYLWDTGRRPEALARLRGLAEPWDRLPSLLRPSLAAELAIAIGLVEPVAADVEHWLALARGPLVERHRLALAEGIAAHLAGDGPAARSKLDEARVALGSSRFPTGPLEREQLEEVERALDG